MSFIRSKMINGCGPYYYEVKSVREGGTVRQVHIRYVGKYPGSSGRIPLASAVPKTGEGNSNFGGSAKRVNSLDDIGKLPKGSKFIIYRGVSETELVRIEETGEVGSEAGWATNPEIAEGYAKHRADQEDKTGHFSVRYAIISAEVNVDNYTEKLSVEGERPDWTVPGVPEGLGNEPHPGVEFYSKVSIGGLTIDKFTRTSNMYGQSAPASGVVPKLKLATVSRASRFVPALKDIARLEHVAKKDGLSYRLMTIHPRESLKLQWGDPLASEGFFRQSRYFSQPSYDNIAKRLKNGEEIDVPYIEVKRKDGGWKVADQEGRHRSLAACDQGIGEIPIFVVFRGAPAPRDFDLGEVEPMYGGKRNAKGGRLEGTTSGR